MLNKLGKGLRWLGEKVTGGASWLGSKVGGTLLSMSPALIMVSPNLGAGAASAGAVLRGVGALGDMGGATLRGSGVNTQAIRQSVGNIRSDVQGVKPAYNAVRGPGNPLERPRYNFCIQAKPAACHYPTISCTTRSPPPSPDTNTARTCPFTINPPFSRARS